MSALSGAQHLALSGRTSFAVDKALRARRLSRARLSPVRRARGARRHSGAARRSDSARAGLAREFARRKAHRRVRWPRLCGDAGDDLADGIGRRGFRLDPARARLPHGPPPAVAAEARAGGRGRDGRRRSTAGRSCRRDDIGDARRNHESPPNRRSSQPAGVRRSRAVGSACCRSVTPSPDAERIAAAAVEAAPVEAAPVEAAVEAAAEPASAEAPVAEAPAEQPVAETASAPEAATEPAAASEAAPAEAAAAEAKPDTPAEPELVEVWRPGGRSEERRPHHDRNRQRHHGRPRGRRAGRRSRAPARAARARRASEQRHRRGRRHNEFRKPREGAPADAAAAAPLLQRKAQPPTTEARQERPRASASRARAASATTTIAATNSGDRNKGDRNKGGDRGPRDKGRDFGGRDKGGRDKRDSGPSHRQWATSAAPRERDRPVDPNSPFAKLAALKEQLAGNRKE